MRCDPTEKRNPQVSGKPVLRQTNDFRRLFPRPDARFPFAFSEKHDMFSVNHINKDYMEGERFIMSASQTLASTIAGSWYPGNPAQLKAMIDSFLAPCPKPEKPCNVVVVPHAGYP